METVPPKENYWIHPQCCQNGRKPGAWASTKWLKWMLIKTLTMLIHGNLKPHLTFYGKYGFQNLKMLEDLIFYLIL